MKTNSQIRQDAFTLLKSNWGASILVVLVYSAVVSVLTMFISAPCMLFNYATDSFWGNVLRSFLEVPLILFVRNPMVFSMMMVFLMFVRNGQNPNPVELIKIFKSPYYMKSVGTMFLMDLYIYLWSLLFIVPGFIKALSYAVTPFVLADNPNLKADDAICVSMAMMHGHKAQLFFMILGCSGAVFLSLLFCGIPLIFVIPYYQIVMAEFYEEVKADYYKRRAMNY